MYASKDVRIRGYFYVREQGREDPWLFFEAKMGREQKTFWKL